MAEEFSGRLDWEIKVPEYPSPRWRSSSFTEKMQIQILGDQTIEETVSAEPDLVYTDGPLYAAQLKLLAVRRGRRIPQIVHLRGDWWREYWSWFSKASTRRRLLGTQQFFSNWTGLVTARKVTPICRWLQEIVRHYLPGKKTEVVYQGVDPGEFYPQSGLDFESPAVAIIQNHTVYPKVAGLLKLKPVMERLRNIHFYIAEGEPVDQHHLRSVKETYSKVSNVHFVPNVSNLAKVRQMLTACNVYVLASELDCCPTTVLEASLMKRPVIASRVGGVPEIVPEGVTGWTIDNNRTDEWIEKILLTVNDTKLNHQLGKHGRSWVAKHFSWKNVARQVEDLILSEVYDQPANSWRNRSS
jgi:glycosyltransferase involved in cell wall biosynthesis